MNTKNCQYQYHQNLIKRSEPPTPIETEGRTDAVEQPSSYTLIKDTFKLKKSLKLFIQEVLQFSLRCEVYYVIHLFTRNLKVLASSNYPNSLCFAILHYLINTDVRLLQAKIHCSKANHKTNTASIIPRNYLSLKSIHNSSKCFNPQRLLFI
jgi:hypothetical protein